ncbi:MAG: PRC-barrel domain-containing protein [Planctomycetaceae bacterium]|nr:PRC-barrel domain-containing protein [Planctomycetaceae bacterium]
MTTTQATVQTLTLASMRTLASARIHAADKPIGKVEDFYFEQRNWIVRYLVLDTHVWLPGRRVLVAPAAVEDIDWSQGEVHLALSREQVRNSPSVDDKVTISREHETMLAKYFGWLPYWESRPLPESLSRSVAAEARPEDRIELERHRKPESTLTAYRETLQYNLAAIDGEFGSVEDFLIDPQTWEMRYVTADVGTLFHKRLVMLSTDWLADISWARRQVRSKMTQDRIRSSPPVPEVIDRAYEIALHEHFARPGYWTSDE